jgi:hypothetical protein
MSQVKVGTWALLNTRTLTLWPPRAQPMVVRDHHGQGSWPVDPPTGDNRG